MTVAGADCEGADGGRAHECVTCGDVASWMRVVTVEAGGELARCSDADGRSETVATELVGEVSPDDELLVHAGVAIARETRTAGAPVRGGGQ